MENKEFILQRITIYTDENFDPTVDENVIQVLRDKFNIYLPQRSTLNDSLESTASIHEIVELILKYRNLS
jgi:DNA polymerase I-like protein with 3'-5' exonuclease and polymerase domains